MYDTQPLTAAALLRLSHNPQLHALLFHFEQQLAELTATGAADLDTLYSEAIAAGIPRHTLDVYAERWLSELTQHAHLCFALGVLIGNQPLTMMLGEGAE